MNTELITTGPEHGRLARLMRAEQRRRVEVSCPDVSISNDQMVALLAAKTRKKNVKRRRLYER